MFFEDEELEKEKKIFPLKYSCLDCKTSFYSFQHEEKCVICNSHNIQESSDSINENTYYYIPVVKSFDDAFQDYYKKVFWHPFIPFSFKRRKLKESMRLVYLPFRVCNTSLDGNISFTGGDKEEIIKDKIKYIETKKYNVLYNVHFDYNDVLFSTCSNMQDKIISFLFQNSLDNVQDLIQYNGDGKFVLTDNNVDGFIEKEKNTIMNHSLMSVREVIPHKLSKLNDNQVDVLFSNERDVFIPVYLLSINYHNKNYFYYMNGKTGKSFVERPIGLIETILFSILIFVFIFFLSFLILYFL